MQAVLLRNVLTVIGLMILTIPLVACNDESSDITSVKSGKYELIHAVVRSSELPEASTSRYDIKQERNNLLLTLVVKDKATGHNVPAELEVTVFNAAGQLLDIEVEKVVSNDMVSYLGTLEVELPAQLDFQVKYRPQGEADMFESEFSENFQDRKPR